jgi:transposase
MGMGRVERLARIGIMRFEELLERWEKGSLSHAEAASALGVSERTLRRWRERYEEEGAEGLIDRRVGRPSPRRAPEDELERVRALYQQHDQGFTIKHFHEKLERRHGYKLGYTTTRLHLQKTGMVRPAADARHAAASGRLEARLARRPAGARPGDHHG